MSGGLNQTPGREEHQAGGQQLSPCCHRVPGVKLKALSRSCILCHANFQDTASGMTTTLADMHNAHDEAINGQQRPEQDGEGDANGPRCDMIRSQEHIANQSSCFYMNNHVKGQKQMDTSRISKNQDQDECP